MSIETKYVQEQVDVIIDSIYNGVIAVDRDGVITLFNPAAERLLDIDADKALGEHIEKIIPDSGLYRVLESKRCLLNQRQRVGNAVVICNRTPVIEDNEIVGAVSIFQDITELEQIADELEHVKELKSTLEEVIENPYEGIILVDKDGLVKMINDTYLSIVGRKREEVIGTHISLISENCNLPQVLKTGEPLLCDFCNVREQGLITMRVPIIRDGQMIGALGKTLFTDINVAKVLIEKLNQLENQLAYYKEACDRLTRSNYFFEDIIGHSDMINSVKNMAWRVARSVSTVLITGESGTGKELFAHAIHNASERRKKPFIKVNCAAIPDNLLESELFGYVDGAFTGAKKGGKPGKFELADRGTIFLDEIGDMPLLMQAKLLRVLQDREVERIGSLEPILLDVRVIAATNQDLELLVAEGKFREDLYYRLNIIQIDVPALRERLEDIPIIVDALIAKLNVKLRKQVKGMSIEALTVLQEYRWPGNIRELENVLELAMNMTEAEILDYEDFPCVVKKIGYKTKLEGKSALGEIMALVEKQTIQEALEKNNWDKKRVAENLGIHPSALYRKLNKYGIALNQA